MYIHVHIHVHVCHVHMSCTHNVQRKILYYVCVYSMHTTCYAYDMSYVEEKIIINYHVQ